MSKIDLMAELDDPCPRGCGRSADECDEAEDGEDCAGSPLVQQLEHEMEKRQKRIESRDRTIAELNASNASLIRRVAEADSCIGRLMAWCAEELGNSTIHRRIRKLLGIHDDAYPWRTPPADDAPSILDIVAQAGWDAAKDEIDALKAQLAEVGGPGIDVRLQEYAVECHELSVNLAVARKDRDELRQHILDIDAHATPYGDIPGDPGWVGTYLLTAGALHRALGKIGHSAPKCQAEAQVAELGASNASLIRRVADLENQLAAVKAVVAAAKAVREAESASPYLGVGPETLELIIAVDAYDAAGKGETVQDPWAANDVYTVPCPTCRRKANVYCVNPEGREVYPAHAARYQRLTEPMDVPIDGV